MSIQLFYSSLSIEKENSLHSVINKKNQFYHHKRFPENNAMRMTVVTAACETMISCRFCFQHASALKSP
jgi:hypothetical protein